MCRSVEVRQAVLAANDSLAGVLRDDLARRGVTVVNMLSSPGSGKTALLEALLRRCVARGVPAAALTADLATENDARRLARSGAPVKQVLTGGLCHLEAAQLRGHLDGWLPQGVRVLFVENVGNLVCPAAYDLGETLRLALMSVTEGEDKPAKYPAAFGLAHLVVLTKTDLADAVAFDAAAFTSHVERVNPGVALLRTSTRPDHGVDALLDHVLAVCDGTPPHRPLLAADHLRDHAHEHGADGPGHHGHGHGADGPDGPGHHTHTHTHAHGLDADGLHGTGPHRHAHDHAHAGARDQAAAGPA